MAAPSTVCASCLRALRNTASRRPTTTTTTTTSIFRQSSSKKPYSNIPPAATLRRMPPSHRPHTITTALPSIIHHRALATATEPNTTAQPARPILNPRTDSSGTPMRINLSPRASHRLNAIATSDANPNLALRITVESGGCHGFQYLMSLVDLSANPPAEEDTVFEGDRGEKVVVDEPSLELLNGSTVDYTMELIGSQFKVTGIPGATSSCGCGTSFDIKF